MDGSYQSLEALPIEHLQIVFVASSSCSDDDAPADPPVCQQRPAPKKTLANGFAGSAPPKGHDVKAKSKKSPSKTVASKKVAGKDRSRVRRAGAEKKAEEEEEVLDTPPEGFPLRRVISIEEDHLPHLLHGGPQPLLHQLSEEEDEVQEGREAQDDLETSVTATPAAPAAPPKPLSSPLTIQVLREAPRAKKSHFSLSSRGQPVGKETQQVWPELPVQPTGNLLIYPNICLVSDPQGTKEGPLFAPDRLFKVVLVGNSSVGKTSLLRSFCEGRFHPSTTATVGESGRVVTASSL